MIKSIAKVLSSHIITKVLGVLNIVIILLFLTVKDFGFYSYILLLLNLIGVIIDPFLSAYLVDYRTFNYKRYNFGILFFSLILFPFFYLIIKYVTPNVTLKLFIFYGLTFLLATGLKSFLNAKEEYLNYGLVDVFKQFSILTSTLIFFYWIKSNDYIKLLELNYIVSFIVVIILFLKLIKPRDIDINFKFSTLKKFAITSRFFLLYTALIPALSFIDSYFVENYLSEVDLGLYSFSLKVYNISLTLMLPALTVLNIEQIKVAKNENYYSFFKRNSKKVFMVATGLFLSFFIANLLLTHYFFTQYKASFFDTNILLIASYICYISMPFSFLIAYRRYKWLLLLVVIALLLNVVINITCITKYGTFIAALSTLISQIIINLGGAILSYYLLHKRKE